MTNSLAARRSTGSIAPSSPLSRGDVTLDENVRDTGTLLFPKRFLPKEKWDLEAMDKARRGVERHLAIVAQSLEGKTWLVGERYTLADVCYTPFAVFFGLMEVALLPAVAAWAERLLARPSAVKTKPDV